MHRAMKAGGLADVIGFSWTRFCGGRVETGYDVRRLQL